VALLDARRDGLVLVCWFTTVLLFKGTGSGEEARWLDFVLGGVGALWFARLAKEVRRNWQLERRAGRVVPQNSSSET